MVNLTGRVNTMQRSVTVLKLFSSCRCRRAARWAVHGKLGVEGGRECPRAGSPYAVHRTPPGMTEGNYKAGGMTRLPGKSPLLLRQILPRQLPKKQLMVRVDSSTLTESYDYMYRCLTTIRSIRKASCPQGCWGCLKDFYSPCRI